MKQQPKRILETERLYLREISLSDSEFIYRLVNSPKWIKFIGDRKIRSIKDAKKYITDGPIKSYKINGFGLWLIELKDSLIPIGICGLLKRDYLQDHDIGFAILPEYENNGYTLEAAEATLSFAKSKLNISKILAFTLNYNGKSISLLNKLGLTFDKMIHIPNDDEELALFSKLL